MIVSIERDTGKFIGIRESELKNKDFKLLADIFASSTLPIWRAQLETNGQSDVSHAEKELAE